MLLGAGVGVLLGDGVGVDVGVGVGEGEIEGDGEGTAAADRPDDGGGVELSAGFWWLKGSQFNPAPAKGSQVGDDPVSQTNVPGPRPSTKAPIATARRSATTEDAIRRR